MRVAVLAAMLGACSFTGGDAAQYRCDPAAPSCPSGERCSRDGYCEAPGYGGGSGPSGSGADAMPDATELDQPDAASASSPDAAVATTTITFGERAGTDFSGVTRDTYLDQNNPGSTFGSDDSASFDADPLRYALVRFDLSGAPAGATVVQADLVLYFYDPLEDGDCVIAPLLEGWSEKYASWALRQQTASWSMLGGTVGPEAVRFTPSSIGEYTVSLPPALVQGWLADPTTNFGVRLMSTSPDGRGGQWDTRESGHVDQRPLLRLTIR
jgi:hypothetical protein